MDSYTKNWILRRFPYNFLSKYYIKIFSFCALVYNKFEIFVNSIAASCFIKLYFMEYLLLGDEYKTNKKS